MKYVRTAAAGLALAAAGAAASSAPEHQAVTGPIAEYWMSAATTTGMGGMMGGGRPNVSQMMSGGFNPNQASHTLILQLGSSRKPDGGDPAAQHRPPPGLNTDPVLPLVTPQPQAAPTHQEAPAGPPPQYQQPHGKMLIFWGCGEHAGPNQPFVIDFATLGTAEAGQKFMGLMHGLSITPMQPPSPQRNTTYGEWPNQQSSGPVPPDGSLIGQHLVKGNYSPEIQFTLGPTQDFLPPFQLTTNQKNPTGSATLGWQQMPGAQGFFATMLGAQSQDQIVMWTSSALQAPAFGMPEYLSDREIARLVANQTLLPGSATECVIPEEAVQAAGGHSFFTLAAYGDEANFAYPPRPPAPQPWHIEWTVKVRYRSSTAGIVGVDMSRMGQGQGQQGQKKPPPKRPGLGSFLPGGLGGMIP
jgi:hypothetical protein